MSVAAFFSYRSNMQMEPVSIIISSSVPLIILTLVFHFPFNLYVYRFADRSLKESMDPSNALKILKFLSQVILYIDLFAASLLMTTF